MNFTNIENFENRMTTANVDIAFFTIVYSECSVECVYSKNLRKFLFAIVDKNIGFTCSLNGTYANAFINHKEAVAALADCRNGGWDPKHFYDALNKSLPTANFTQATKEKYKSTSSVAVSNFEDRIYFHHWKNANISPRQIEKTIELLGNEVVTFCKETGVTPVYFDHITDRTMDVATNFKDDYNAHNAENDA